MNLEVLVLPVFNGYHVESCSVREHQASRFLNARKASGMAHTDNVHPSPLMFAHLACNIRPHVSSLKPAGSYRGWKPDQSCVTSASEHQTQAAKAYSKSSTTSLSGVFMCQKPYLSRQLHTLRPTFPKPSAAPSYQPLVPGEDDGVEHGLVEEAIAHPLWDDNVHLLHRQLHLLHLALEDGNDCGVESHKTAGNKLLHGTFITLMQIGQQLYSQMTLFLCLGIAVN